MNSSASKTRKKTNAKTPIKGQKTLSSFFNNAKSKSSNSPDEDSPLEDSPFLISSEVELTPKQDIDKKRKRSRSSGNRSFVKPNTKRSLIAKSDENDTESTTAVEVRTSRMNNDRGRNISIGRSENQENDYKQRDEKKSYSRQNSSNELVACKLISNNFIENVITSGEVKMKDDFRLMNKSPQMTENNVWSIFEEETTARNNITQSKTNQLNNSNIEFEKYPRVKEVLKNTESVSKKEEENGKCDDIMQELFTSSYEFDIDESSFKCDEKKTKSNSQKEGDDFMKFEQSNSISTDDFEDIFDDDWNGDVNVDLSTLQRCQVSDIIRDNFHNLIVHAVHVESQHSITVKLMGFWKNTRLQPDDIINIQARKQSDAWVVDNNFGFVVEQPDFLVSGTSVVGALFCPRRGVLSDRFKGVETITEGQQGLSLMVIGSLVHQLVQEVLKKKIYTKPGIAKLLKDILTTPNTSQLLYSAGISMEACQKDMSTFVPKVYNFVERYVKAKASQSTDANFNGRINVVQDIEENLWVPQLGVKGKVDATVEVNVNLRRRIMPLELKTGRASFSLEHRGQVILYIMMMEVTGQDVNTGLLLYLRENIMREIKAVHPEKRDLILLRNNLAYYLTRKPRIPDRSDSGLEFESQIDSMELPEPINHRACQNCPYSALCCAYLKNDRNFQPTEQHPLVPIMRRLDEYLKPEHIDYVKKWVKMLQIEEADQINSQSLKQMWTIPPMQRETNGKCISNLKVTGQVVEESGRFHHIFIRVDPNDPNVKKDFTKCGISMTEYVIVSTNTKINICAGPVIKLSKDSITLSLERNLSEKKPNEVFHIDIYSSQSMVVINLSNIGYLLDDNAVTEKMRKIVVEREPAKFSNKFDRSLAVAAAQILKTLNEMQQRAVMKIIAAKDYLLIKGMPGSGKTKTLVAAIELLVKLGKSVLLTAHTHSAVDNVLLKLIETNVDFVRLGSSSRIHPSLLPKSEYMLTKDCYSPESLDAAYNSKNVVCVTCLGANHPLFKRRIFDVCLVDESTQVLQSSLLRPLYSASKFVLMGDPDQLPPVVKSDKARELGMDQSLFERLDSDNNTVTLNSQYRMNQRIMSLANKVTYKGKLTIGTDQIANATLHIPNKSIINSWQKWVRTVLSTDLNHSIVVLDTGDKHDILDCSGLKSSDYYIERRYSNLCEAGIIKRLVTTLVEAGVLPEKIGVIAPYKEQVNLLKDVIEEIVEVNTVDQYQGRDKEIIFYSGTRSACSRGDTEKVFNILDDHRRLTVAITRAKHKLIVVGDIQTLKQFRPFQKLFEHVESENVVVLKEDYDDFKWKELLLPVKC